MERLQLFTKVSQLTTQAIHLADQTVTLGLLQLAVFFQLVVERFAPLLELKTNARLNRVGTSPITRWKYSVKAHQA